MTELTEQLKTVPEEVIYCHTYRCLEENPYRAIESPNDFSSWVRDVLENKALSEKLANINIFGCTRLQTLRNKFIAVLEDYLSSGYNTVTVPYGREFYFVKATSIISPTHYIAHDLREFIESLRKINLDSLYYHVFGIKITFGKRNE